MITEKQSGNTALQTTPKQQWLYRNWDKCAVFGMILILFGFMVRYSSIQSFWLDEMWQVGAIHESLSWREIFEYRLVETTPPLYSLMMAVWYRMVPFGETWLLLPSMLFLCVGVYFTYLLGKKAFNKRAGVFAAVLASTSSWLIMQGGFEFRSNSLHFMLGAIALYMYCVRYDQGRNVKSSTLILYGVSLLFLAFVHYFGPILIVAIFVSDFFLFIKKKIKFRCVISYFIMGLPLLAWLMIIILRSTHIETLQNFWPRVPTLFDIPDLFRGILSGDVFLWALLIAAVSYFLTRTFLKIADKSFDFEKDYIPAAFMFVAAFVVGLTFVYSATADVGSSLWVVRYFVALLPIIYILMSAIIDKLYLRIAGSARQRKIILASVVCFLFLFFGIEGYTRVRNQASELRQPFRQAANWLLRQDDIHNDETLILTSNCPTVTRGWRYYITRRGTRQGFIPHNQAFLLGEEAQSYSMVYVLEWHNTVRPDIQTHLQDNFEIVNTAEEYRITVWERKE